MDGGCGMLSGKKNQQFDKTTELTKLNPLITNAVDHYVSAKPIKEQDGEMLAM